MAKVIYIGAQDKLVEPSGKATNIFYRFLDQIRIVVTSFAELDGNADDISDGDVNRFRELADMVVTRNIDGRIETIEQNGKTTTVTRDIDNRIEMLTEVVDADPTKVTIQEIARDIQDRISEIDVTTTGYELN